MDLLRLAISQGPSKSRASPIPEMGGVFLEKRKVLFCSVVLMKNGLLNHMEGIGRAVNE